tara:strand:+ start:820 stop:1689 length:870 start_codon:yes stop_codon:yes gene_type:complete
MRRAISLFIIGSLALATPSRAAETPSRYFSAEYRIYAGGILLSKVELQLDLSSDEYRVSAHIAPAGLGHIASNSHVVATSYGGLDAGEFVPKHLDLSWANDEGIKSSWMRYKDGAPVEFVSGYALPPEGQSDTTVDIDSIGAGTTDPFLAMLAPLTTGKLVDACQGEQQIFDGRRHASLTLISGQELTPSEHEYPSQIAALACKVVWAPIAGYSKRSIARAAEFPPVEAHYGRIQDTQFAAPLEMRGETRYGALSIYAVRFFTETPSQAAPFDIQDYSYEFEPDELDED